MLHAQIKETKVVNILVQGVLEIRFNSAVVGTKAHFISLLKFERVIKAPLVCYISQCRYVRGMSAILASVAMCGVF